MTRLEILNLKFNLIIQYTNLLSLALFQKATIVESLLTLKYKISGVKSRKNTLKLMQQLQNRIAEEVNVANLNDE